MVARWIGGHCGLSPDFAKMILSGGCEGHNLPQGVIAQLWREIAGHRPGLITKTGLGTFVDPRIEGGKMNAISTKDLVKVIAFEGEEWLFYPSFPVDVAIIRGTTADENGNLTVDDEGALFEILPLAQATKNGGGIVIAEVEYVAEPGTLNPKSVRVPGVLIDHIVVSAPEIIGSPPSPPSIRLIPAPPSRRWSMSRQWRSMNGSSSRVAPRWNCPPVAP